MSPENALQGAENGPLLVAIDSEEVQGDATGSLFTIVRFYRTQKALKILGSPPQATSHSTAENLFLYLNYGVRPLFLYPSHYQSNTLTAKTDMIY